MSLSYSSSGFKVNGFFRLNANVILNDFFSTRNSSVTPRVETEQTFSAFTLNKSDCETQNNLPHQPLMELIHTHHQTPRN
jgi:hypothetical protein